MQEGGELEVAHPIGAQAESRPGRERELDHVAAVLTRVAVVVFDDIPQHERHAAVRAVELGEVLDPGAALAGEHGRSSGPRRSGPPGPRGG